MNLSPDVKCARRFVHRLNLKPPFDIDDLVRKYAALEYCSLPDGVDGICENLKIPSKRRVFISNKIGKRRRAFTAAHELGHIIIPWHTGTIVDQNLSQESDEFDSLFNDLIVREMEAEENRFASEILMPIKWMESIERELPSLYWESLNTRDLKG